MSVYARESAHLCHCACLRAWMMHTLEAAQVHSNMCMMVCSKTQERRQLCGFLARAVPSLRGDVLNALDDAATTNHGADGATASARKKRARAEQASDADEAVAEGGANQQTPDRNSRMCSLLPLVTQVAASPLGPVLQNAPFAALGCACRVGRARRPLPDVITPAQADVGATALL